MKRFYIPLSIGLLCVVAVTVLYLTSAKPAVKNGFDRNFADISLEKIGETDLKFNSYYISGIAMNRIMLANYLAPLYVLQCSFDLKDTTTLKLPFRHWPDIAWGIAKIQVNDTNIYLTESKTPAYLSTRFGSIRQEKENLQGLKFDLVKVIAPGSLAIRYYDYVLKQKMFQKVTLKPNLKSGKIYRPKTQGDGNFALDGFFIFNNERGKIYYSCYYNNVLTCLDTNMNLLYRARTIDTNTVSKIKVVEVVRGNTREKLMAETPVVVNKRGYALGDWLYINSGLASDQEDYNTFQAHSVIDVYAQADGAYYQSFTIPNYKHKKISDFAINGDILVALYGQYLVCYKMEKTIGN